MSKPKPVYSGQHEYLSDWSISNGLTTGFLTIEDGELEKLCACCDDYWPATKEFWHLDRGRFKSRCKACWLETRHHSQIPPTNIKGRPRKELRQ